MLNRSVLVLNRSWTPIAITTIKRSLSLVFRDHARIVDPNSYQMFAFDEWLAETASTFDPESPAREGHLRTATLEIRLPEVVVLSKFNGVPRYELAFSRKNVLRRDEFVCQYCGTKPGLKMLSIDHVLPVSRGGPNSWDNCVTACVRCNTRKGNRTPREANMPLLSVPDKPRWTDGVGVDETAPESWSSFVRA